MNNSSISDLSVSRSNRINRILQPEQIAEILDTLFSNRPIKILRTIARTGKYAQSVPWVHYECEITGMRRATFISFQDLLQGFWAWLECANLMLMTLWEVNAVIKTIWSVLRVGTWVDHKSMGKSQIVEKDTNKKGKLRLWLRNRGRSYAVSPLELAVSL